MQFSFVGPLFLLNAYKAIYYILNKAFVYPTISDNLCPHYDLLQVSSGVHLWGTFPSVKFIHILHYLLITLFSYNLGTLCSEKILIRFISPDFMQVVLWSSM